MVDRSIAAWKILHVYVLLVAQSLVRFHHAPSRYASHNHRRHPGENYIIFANVLNLQVTRNRRYNPAANSVIYSLFASVVIFGDPLAVYVELKSSRTRDSVFVLICTTVSLTSSIMSSICERRAFGEAHVATTSVLPQATTANSLLYFRRSRAELPSFLHEMTANCFTMSPIQWGTNHNAILRRHDRQFYFPLGLGSHELLLSSSLVRWHGVCVPRGPALLRFHCLFMATYIVVGSVGYSSFCAAGGLFAEVVGPAIAASSWAMYLVGAILLFVFRGQQHLLPRQ